jgi:hypothetical protein
MKKDSVIVSEHILEVRHQASGRFLDVRGLVADHIKTGEIFPHWQIDTNVVNFRDASGAPKKIGAFVGYKSAGLYVYDPDTRNYFEDKVGKFWRSLTSCQLYALPELTRFGCRTKAFLNSEKSFDEINRNLYAKFFSRNFHEMLGERQKDLQVVIDLESTDFSIRITCGPIHKEEATRYFSFSSDHFKETGVYIDIDYSKKENIDIKEVPKLTKSAIQATWERIDKIAQEVEI